MATSTASSHRRAPAVVPVASCACRPWGAPPSRRDGGRNLGIDEDRSPRLALTTGSGASRQDGADERREGTERRATVDAETDVTVTADRSIQATTGASAPHADAERRLEHRRHGPRPNVTKLTGACQRPAKRGRVDTRPVEREVRAHDQTSTRPAANKDLVARSGKSRPIAERGVRLSFNDASTSESPGESSRYTDN